MKLDWQTIVTIVIGLLALGHLVRRWWPGLKGLLNSKSAPPSACAPDGSSGHATSCNSGCGQCGQSGRASLPSKDHRHRVVPIKQG